MSNSWIESTMLLQIYKYEFISSISNAIDFEFGYTEISF